MELNKKIRLAYDELQRIEITATRGNMEKLIFVLNVLKEVYQEIDKNRKDDGNNGEV